MLKFNGKDNVQI